MVNTLIYSLYKYLLSICFMVELGPRDVGVKQIRGFLSQSLGYTER